MATVHPRIPFDGNQHAVDENKNSSHVAATAVTNSPAIAAPPAGTGAIGARARCAFSRNPLCRIRRHYGILAVHFIVSTKVILSRTGIVRSFPDPLRNRRGRHRRSCPTASPAPPPTPPPTRAAWRAGARRGREGVEAEEGGGDLEAGEAAGAVVAQRRLAERPCGTGAQRHEADHDEVAARPGSTGAPGAARGGGAPAHGVAEYRYDPGASCVSCGTGGGLLARGREARHLDGQVPVAERVCGPARPLSGRRERGRTGCMRPAC